MNVLLAAHFWLTNFWCHMLPWHRPKRLCSYQRHQSPAEQERSSSQVTKTNAKLQMLAGSSSQASRLKFVWEKGTKVWERWPHFYCDTGAMPTMLRNINSQDLITPWSETLTAEWFMLEKASKTTESNCEPTAAKPLLNHIPKCDIYTP